MRPAGFLRRYAAYSLDLVVPVAVSVPLLWRTGQKMMARTWQHMAEAELRLYDLMALSESRGAHALADLPGWSSDPALRKALLAMVAAWLEAIGIAALVIAALAALWDVPTEEVTLPGRPGTELPGLDEHDLVVVLRGAHAPLWGRPDARIRGLLDHAPCTVLVVPPELAADEAQQTTTLTAPRPGRRS